MTASQVYSRSPNAARPNPSLKRSANGSPPGPVQGAGPFSSARAWRATVVSRLAHTLGVRTLDFRSLTSMNKYLAAAGTLAFLVGAIHSVLGERLIFRRMRIGTIIPTNGGKVIGEGHVRIIWASWHIVTLFGSLTSIVDAMADSRTPWFCILSGDAASQIRLAAISQPNNVTMCQLAQMMRT